MSDFASKPIEPERLHRTLQDGLRRRAAVPIQ
jgi:hypothetical protein